jgi:hypothetical protein
VFRSVKDASLRTSLFFPALAACYCFHLNDGPGGSPTSMLALNQLLAAVNVEGGPR